ncbi:magnetosome-associated protein MamJ-like [Phycodurus eques]|uniref:magnetosome-associated protein MamJ-like n=1 Tax=Phycodurus eques TaxID=693459 RepID=UPI002ACD62B4|nr:magnetosome-associated protein MamJ-like [Phycodurus eques]
MPSKRKKNQRRMRRVVKPEVLEPEPVAKASEGVSTTTPEPELTAKQEDTRSEERLTAPEQKAEPESMQEVVCNAPEREIKMVEIKSVEQVVACVPQLVSCTFVPETVIEAEPADKVEPELVEQVVARVPQLVRCTFYPETETEAKQAVKVEPESEGQVVASVPELVSCIFDPETVTAAKPAVKVETEPMEEVVASVPEVVSSTFNPEPEKRAIQKVTEEVVCYTLDPEPVVEEEVAVNVESQSVEQVPELVCCTFDIEPVEQGVASLPEQVEHKKTPEAEPKEIPEAEHKEIPEAVPNEIPEAEPVAGIELKLQKVAEQVVVCSLGPEPVAEAVKPVQEVVLVPEPEVVVNIPKPEAVAEAQPVAVKVETESVKQLVEPPTEVTAEIQEDTASASLKCPSEESSISCQMQLGSSMQIPLEAALNCHLIPEVSIEG